MSSSTYGARRRSEERRVLAGTLVGTTIEWYDFFIYAQAAAFVLAPLLFAPLSHENAPLAPSPQNTPRAPSPVRRPLCPFHPPSVPSWRGLSATWGISTAARSCLPSPGSAGAGPRPLVACSRPMRPSASPRPSC